MAIRSKANSLHKTPLYDEHVRLGGKVVDFNGWALPVQFTGIVEEHEHTRAQVSLFDCSHMGEYRVLGYDAIAAFDAEIITDTSKVPVGRCRYGAILNDNGGIVDDIITFRMTDDELFIVTNAGPIEHVTDRLCSRHPGIQHLSYETAKIDVQGPKSRECVLRAGFKEAESLKYFNCLWTSWRGHAVLLSRTGYTGELGYELFMPNELAAEAWDLFLDMDGVKPAGLGARDTLRTEVGYCLSGQDFDESCSPLESGMESYIAWHTEFVGKSALEAQRNEGGHRVLVPIKTDSRRAPRHGMEIKRAGEVVGVVTSGTFGPSVGHGVGLARVDQEASRPGTKLCAGPKELEIEITESPVYKNGTCRMKI